MTIDPDTTSDRAPRRPRRPRSPRSTGLLIALAFALIGGGVVLFVALLNKPEPTDSVQTGRAGGEPSEATDITEVGSTSDARIQVADKKRPGRVAADLYFKQLDHAGGGAYDALLPRAFLYQPDGRTIFVRSDRGRVRMPSQSDAPESGEFSGNGLVLVFPPRAPGDTRPINPDHDSPTLVAHFKTASFDTVLLEVSTRDEVTIQTPDSTATMLGALVRGNQVHDRLEFARFGPGEIRYRTDDDAHTEPDTPAAAAMASKTEAIGESSRSPSHPRHPSTPQSVADAATRTPSATSPASATRQDPATETLYRTLFTGGVTLSQSTRQLSSENLIVWSRFIDNKLPENALGPKKTPRPDKSAHTRRIVQTPSAFVGTPPMRIEALIPALLLVADTPTHTLFSPNPTDVILTWKKEVVTAPIAPTPVPRELADGNHIHARFTADRAGGQQRITLNDSAIGAAGICGTLDYAATTRQLDLAQGPGVDRVDIIAPAMGRFAGPNFGINLGTGIAQVRGGGTLLALQTDGITVVPEADPDAPLPESAMRRIAWRDQADLIFYPGADGQAIDGAIKTASFTGDILARDHWSSLSGDFLKADFDRFELPQGKVKSSLRHLHVDGRALAVGAPSPKHTDPDRPLPPFDPYIAAETLDVDFKRRAEDKDDVDPTRVVARGTSGEGTGKRFVHVADGTSELATMSLIAELRPDATGKITVSDVVADQQVRLDRSDGVWATADKLIASGVEKWADLTSDDPVEQPVALGLGDQSTIRGPQIHLEDAQGLLHVFGAGVLDHLQPVDNAGQIDPALATLADPDIPPGMMRVRASWSRSMLFINQTGRIECHGDAEVSARSAADGRVARCERLLLNLSPESESKPDTTAASSHTDGLFGDMGDRRLLTAEMVGACAEREGGPPASVKAWTYGLSATGERTFNSVLYLDSPRIGTDESTGIITVPEAGTGLIFDAGRQSAAAGSSAAAPSIGPSGDTRFRWKEKLSFNRSNGELKLLKGVELEHLATGSSEKLTMRCEELTANVDSSSNGRGRLVSATCGGGAIAESGTQLLSADEFVYEGGTDIIRAVSKSDQPVMYTDTRRGAPVLARILSWDRRADRIEIIEPMPIIAPMGK